MKRTEKVTLLPSKTLFLAAMALVMNSCTQQSPLSYSPALQAKKHQIQILKYQDVNEVKLSKIFKVSELITVQNGGQVQIRKALGKGAKIDVTLAVSTGSISRDASITMSLDDELLLISFVIPNGITFREPPTLTVDAKGLDLGDIEIEDLSVYYDASGTGDWKSQSDDSVDGNTDTGSIDASFDTPIVSYSRFAIGLD